MPPESTADQDQLEDRRPAAALTTASNHPNVVGEDLGYLLSSTPNIDLSTIRLIPNEDGTVGIAGRVGPPECPSCHTAGHPCTEYCQAENREYPGQPGERPARISGTTEVVAQALAEYGAAIRGDWGDLDGRSVRYQLDDLVALLRKQPTPAPTIEHLRMEMGVCPRGGGHWTQYCGDVKCESRMG